MLRVGGHSRPLKKLLRMHKARGYQVRSGVHYTLF